jgi:hypothetical protein
MCFCSGAMIRTPTGDVPVDELHPGDRIVTYKHSVRTIKDLVRQTMVNDGSTLTRTLYEHESGLRLTGEHCVLVDGLTTREYESVQLTLGRNSMIDDACLVPACLASGFSRIVDGREYDVYNMTLSGDDPMRAYGVYANGVLCETMTEVVFRSVFGKGTMGNQTDNP